MNFANRIGTAAFYNSNFYTLYPSSYIMNPGSNTLTTAEIKNYISAAYNQASVAYYVNNPNLVYSLENGLTQNLARTTTSGIDFLLNYQRPMSFGAIFGGMSGAYVLTYDQRPTPNGKEEDLDAVGAVRLRMQTTLGVKHGALTAKATWNWTGAYEEPSSINDGYQEHVAPFSVFNLAFIYAPKMTGLLDNVTYTLNIDNLLNTDPPHYNGAILTAGGYGAFDLGRLVQLGVKKKF